MKKTLFALTLLLLSMDYSLGQTFEDSYISGPSVISPAPNASGLGIYGEFPVSQYTGIPNISIPLYTISEGDLSLPVSLSYHSKGVRVEEQASWVGLGWSLNAGGVITRAVVGLPDDYHPNDPITQPFYGTCGYMYVNQMGFLGNANNAEVLYNTSISTTTYSTSPLMDYAESALDGEPDKFFFNFAGMSGEFVFDKNGVPSILSDQKLGITYTRNAAQRLISFKIVDQNGTNYYFDQAELTHYFLNKDQGSLPFPYSYLVSTYQGLSIQEYYSSWYLSKIENANKTHEINFNYANENIKDVREFSYDIKSWLSVPGNDVQQNFGSREYMIYGKRLSSITWTGGSVVFEANHTRQDIGSLHVSDPTSTTNYALTKCSLKDVNNNTVKSFNLNYAYFTSTDFTPAQSDENCLIKRLKLVSLTEESSTSGVTIPPYQFFYDEAYPLPYKASPYTDYWGFANSLTTTAGGPEIPKQYFYPNDPPDPVTLSRYSIYPRTSHNGEILLAGYDKSPNFNYMKSGILTKIIFPTKGYTEFEYEANTFYFMNQNRTGGGLRIKKITSYDGMDHARDIIKNFEYTLSADPSKSSGLIMYLPFFAKYEGYYSNQHRHNFYQNSIAGLGTTQGGYVGYQEVTVNTNGNGKIWSKFHLPAAFGVVNEDLDGSTYIYNRTNSVGSYCNYLQSYSQASALANDNFPYAPNPNYDWNRGSLMEEKVYNNLSQLVKRTVNEYEIKNYKKIYAFKNTKLGTYGCIEGGNSPLSYLSKYAKYYLISGWKVLNHQTTEDYDPATASLLYSNQVWYNYDNPAHMMLTSSKSYDSKNRELKTEYKRPQDYTTSTNFTNDLILQHRYAPVLEQLAWENDGSGYKLLNASFKTYSNFATANGLSNPQWLPDKLYALETGTPITQATFTATAINSGSITLDSRYKQMGEYNYGSEDNLTRYSYLNAGNKNNTTYVWGYNKQYPIANVINATEAECGFTGFESDDQNIWGITTSSQSTDAHTGTYSRNIPVLTYGPGKDFLPTATYRNEKYILSCWVKTSATYGNNAGSLVLYTMQNNGSPDVYPNVSSAYCAIPISNTNNAWKYIEVEIDLKKIKTDAGLPLTTDLKIRSFVWNNDPNISMLVDDMRFYPKEARMNSYTITPLKGTTSMSDENSDAIFYEYDEFGRLKLMKDKFGRIVQKTEYNYKP